MTTKQQDERAEKIRQGRERLALRRLRILRTAERIARKAGERVERTRDTFQKPEGR